MKQTLQTEIIKFHSTKTELRSLLTYLEKKTTKLHKTNLHYDNNRIYCAHVHTHSQYTHIHRFISIQIHKLSTYPKSDI